MTNEELIKVYGGGTSVSGTFINAICKFVNTLLELGRTIGSAIKYSKNGKACT